MRKILLVLVVAFAMFPSCAKDGKVSNVPEYPKFDDELGEEAAFFQELVWLWENSELFRETMIQSMFFKELAQTYEFFCANNGLSKYVNDRDVRKRYADGLIEAKAQRDIDMVKEMLEGEKNGGN